MATPRSRSDSSTGQASVIDFIATAPFEICALVFAPLDNCHLKALRLTCKRLAHLISPHLRFKRVFISASPLDVQVFRAIAEHDIFRRNVREIVWDDARYEKPPPDFVTFEGEYNDECVWPASKDEEGAGYEMWEREKEKDKWRGFRHVIRIVAQQRSATSKITELVFDGNQIHSGLTCGILHTPEPCVEYNHLAAVIKKPGFTTLRLNLMICGADDNNYLAFRNGRLKQMLEADLQHFILETDEDGSLGQEPQPLTATRDHFIPLRSIFPVEERRLITKIDMFLVPYSVLGYWVKYIDQSNLNNAYVAGMKEDLGFYGNELVQLQTLFTLGSVLGQIPFLFIMTYVPIHYLVPICDVLWGVFTLLQYRVNSYAELAAYRFMVGWFEAAFFPAMHYVFGILGYFVIPGTVDQPNKWCVNDDDLRVARERLEKHGHVLHGKMKFGHIKRTLLGFRFWLVITTDVLFWNAGIHKNTGSYLLWIKSLGRYSAAKVNELGTISPAS
ncbi:putative transporter SEO1 [Colletotrichum sp. SAR 10_77]|nr:putative transporter SEO1 [Colletotrichum sp. SAR 10_77]